MEEEQLICVDLWPFSCRSFLLHVYLVQKNVSCLSVVTLGGDS